MEEIWKPVSEWEDCYEISNLGRLRSVPRQIIGGCNSIRYQESVIIKPVVNNRGYTCYVLWRNSKQTRKLAHRLVALSFLPNPESKPFINHIDGDKQNYSLDNLEWCTQKENMHHAWSIGLCKGSTGEKHGMSKLTEIEVRDIYKLAKSRTYHQKTIAEMYGLYKSTVRKILKGQTWKHLNLCNS